MTGLGAQVRSFCATIGRDRLLVQAAGGNVSWKDGDTLWIKASGAWLAEAMERDIFVPVELPPLRSAIARGDFEVQPRLREPGPLRPSIETLLHAVMPHPVVVHLHPVEALAHLVRGDGESAIRDRLDGTLDCAFVGYHMPGAPLARAVHDARRISEADVVFFRSHGAIVGGRDVEEVSARIGQITGCLAGTVRAASPGSVLRGDERPGYRLPDDARLHALATSPAFLSHVRRHWALYPDHVVFLGPAPAVVADPAANLESNPAFLFVQGQGVLQSAATHRGHAPQLICYLDVLERQDDDAELVTLDGDQVAALMGWDAEKYRQALAASSGSRS